MGINTSKIIIVRTRKMYIRERIVAGLTVITRESKKRKWKRS